MSGKTPGGLFLPDKEALELVGHAPWPPRAEEPSAAPDGLKVAAGYLSPYFITDPERSMAELDDAFVLVTGQEIVKAQGLVPILENVARRGKAVLIIAPVIGDEPLALLVLNKLRGTLRVCAVAAANVEPIAYHVRSTGFSAPIEELAIKDLGTAARVRSGMRSTVIGRNDSRAA